MLQKALAVSLAGLWISGISLGEAFSAAGTAEAPDVMEPYPLFSDEPPALPLSDDKTSDPSDMPKSIMEIDSEKAEVNGTVARENQILGEGTEGDMNEAPDKPRQKQWRLGPTLSLSFPYFVSPSLEWKVGKSFSAGLSSGNLKISKDLGTSFDRVELNVKSRDVRFRYHPFRGDFFVGLALGTLDLKVKGKKKTNAEVDNQTTSGIVTSQSQIKSHFLTPHLGWLTVYESGFCFGFELGYHFPYQSSSSYSAIAQDPSLESQLKSSSEFQEQKKDLEGIVKKLGKTAVPYVNLLRIGWLF